MGIGVVGVVVIVNGSCIAFQVRTAIEHVVTVSNCRRTPIIACVDSRQAGAAKEHSDHVRHVLCVEAREVEARQAGAEFEHMAHIRHVPRDKSRHVKVRQAGTAQEHVAHTRHVFSLQVTNASNCRKIFEFVEPVFRSG